MSLWYFVNVLIHVLAALLWLGGMFFLGVVGAPVLRKVEPPELRARIFKLLGVHFRKIGWGAIAVLVVTGTLNLHFRGVLSADVLGSSAFWGTPFGTALAWKLGSVAAMIVVSALHDFVLGPAASRAERGSPEARRLTRHTALLGRLNAILGVILVVAAIRLARGG